MGHPNTGFVGILLGDVHGQKVHEFVWYQKPWLVDLGANPVLDQPRPDGSWLT